MKPCTIIVTDSDGNQTMAEKASVTHKSENRKVSFHSTSPKQSFLKIFHEAQKQIEQLLKSEPTKSSNTRRKQKKFSVGNISGENENKPEKVRRNTVSNITNSSSRPISQQRISKTDYYNDRAVQRESLETIRLSQLVALREVHPDYWMNGETLTEEDLEGIFDMNSTMTGYKNSASKSLNNLPSEIVSADIAPPPRPPKKASVPTIHITPTSRRLSDHELKHSPWKQYCSNFSHLFDEPTYKN